MVKRFSPGLFSHDLEWTLIPKPFWLLLEGKKREKEKRPLAILFVIKKRTKNLKQIGDGKDHTWKISARNLSPIGQETFLLFIDSFIDNMFNEEPYIFQYLFCNCVLCGLCLLFYQSELRSQGDLHTWTIISRLVIFINIFEVTF